MAEEFVWQADSRGDWSLPPSWGRAVDIPGLGDNITFPPESNQSILAGLDQSAVGKFGEINSHPLFGGAFGVPGAPLILSADTFRHEGSGCLNLQISSERMDLLIIETPFVGPCIVTGTGTTDIAQLRISKGEVNVKSVEITRNLYVASARSFSNAPSTIVRLDENCTIGSSTWSVQNGGHISSKTSFLGGQLIYFGGHNMSGGSLTLEKDSDARINRLVQMGGYIKHNSTGINNNAEIMGGTLDYTGDVRVKSLTLKLWPGAVFLKPTTVTTNEDLHLIPGSITGGGG